MTKRLRMDVLKPSTDWCRLDGPQQFRLPGGSIDALARALAAADSGALLVCRGWEYVLRWQDEPPGPEHGDARAIRRYELASHSQDRGRRLAGDERSLPGPFVESAALTLKDAGSGWPSVDATNMRDAIWRLLDKAGAALDAIG